MTIKLVALYKRPSVEVAFLTHYEQVHLPLMQKVPHLEKVEVFRDVSSPFGEAPYFLVAEMHFADRARFDAAMASPENRAAGKDLMTFAKDLVTLLVLASE
ncbi:EthD family reductase [Sphingomonas crocodyli]|uniref:EthD family reductase n=1 Tax=Sphingomonas crocodyli TaxID=1979270 RepID=A0A437M7F3_9SPHN|nr:EthD family reductase [Sphingomonas crocodyli]RVT93557.1 EthD family reductase [Sphingomonas crocodyli]